VSSAGSAYLILSPPDGSIHNHYLLDTSSNNVTIEVSNLPHGVYNVILVCDGAARDIKHLIIN